MVVDLRSERVARALCVEDGADPDSEVEGRQEDFVNPRHIGSGMTTQFFGPVWQRYLKKAKAFIAAYDALTDAV